MKASSLSASLAAVLAVSAMSAATPVRAADVGLVHVVREATRPFLNIHNALNAGYAKFLGCAADQDGAMGNHFANVALVGDGALDAHHPEVLMYERMADGNYRLLGVEFVVLADDWNANHPAPPVLLGQLFHYESSPNRYGLPAFYALHVWAWKSNPEGTFADWNPMVSCDYAR